LTAIEKRRSMDDIFLKVANMNIAANWPVLAAALLRLTMGKAPKWFSCLLWMLAAIRLICPISIGSDLSLIPSTQSFAEELL
jgi:hypothetical protein